MKKKKLTAIALSLCMITGGLVGCGNSEDKKVDAKIENTKVLNIASSAEINTLYPLNMDIQNNLVVEQVYETLVKYDQREIKPCLAESWQFNEDGTVLTFKLRKGVKFHDGTDFNAEAVKKNYDFARLNPNFGNIKALANVKEIKVNDDTVSFVYSNPYFAYLSDFCYPDVMAIVSPTVIEKGNYQKMKGVVGTGPYIYKEIKNGEYTKLSINNTYWGEKAKFDEIIVKYIPESSTSASMFFDASKIKIK